MLQRKRQRSTNVFDNIWFRNSPYDYLTTWFKPHLPKNSGSNFICIIIFKLLFYSLPLYNYTITIIWGKLRDRKKVWNLCRDIHSPEHKKACLTKRTTVCLFFYLYIAIEILLFNRFPPNRYETSTRLLKMHLGFSVKWSLWLVRPQAEVWYPCALLCY